jgi:1,4-alpha-glucan branching enzyme
MKRARERGALALLLHTHMPYVEGFGTWPFGEEWLWEAIASCYLPLLDLLDRGAPLTVSLTPVLCDQLEVADIGARFESFVEGVRRVTHARDVEGLRETGERELAAEVERSWHEYVAAAEMLAARGGDLLGAMRPHVEWTSAATHAVLPQLASDAGVRLQVRSGIASHRRRFGKGWGGGFWLPECAYGPWLERVLEDEGVRCLCVELTAALGLGAAEHLRPIVSESGVLILPIDRATISLVWSDRGYPSAGPYRDYHHHTIHQHKPWANDGSAYQRGRALALAREHAADFVERVCERLRRAAQEARRPLPGGGLVVCALDTELLGHWWYEGPAWLRAVIDEAARQGLDIVRLDDVGELAGDERPVAELEGGLPVSTWGSGADLSTWSGPAVEEIAFGARRAELALLRAAGRARTGAARALLALQSSDWAFMVSRGIAAPYARERFSGHVRDFEAALFDEPAAGAEPELRNLAIDARLDALIGV